MLVNLKDISIFKAKLLKKDIQTAEIEIYQDWLKNSLNPLYLGKQEKHKQVKLQFLINTETDETSLINISNIVKEFEKCTIKFEDLSFYYDCFIVNKSHERKAKGIYILNLELKSGFAYKAYIIETESNITSKTLNIEGNLQTPIIIEVTSQQNINAIIIGSFSLNNLTANKKIIVNAENFTVKEGSNNKFSDFNGDFPILEPGENNISISNPNCDITFKYRSRWL